MAESPKRIASLSPIGRAFSSLLSLPSQAQSVIKAFRRQGRHPLRFCLVMSGLDASLPRPSRINVRMPYCLVTHSASGGKTLISRINLCPSATCRALRACPLWHLWPISASAHADAKTVPKHHRPKRTDGRFRGCPDITVVPRTEADPSG